MSPQDIALRFLPDSLVEIDTGERKYTVPMYSRDKLAEIWNTAQREGRSVRLTAEERMMLVANAKAEEREACAQIADKEASFGILARRIALAIRARK